MNEGKNFSCAMAQVSTYVPVLASTKIAKKHRGIHIIPHKYIEKSLDFIYFIFTSCLPYPEPRFVPTVWSDGVQSRNSALHRK